MIRINLWKFGGRGSSSGGSGGTGSNGNSVSKSTPSSNAPGSGRGGGGRVMDSAAPQSQNKTKAETQEQIEKRITDNRGNVKTIENGQRYNIYTVNGDEEKSYYDKASASETREILEGYSYDERSGTFKGRSGRASFRVKLVKKKK